MNRERRPFPQEPGGRVEIGPPVSELLPRVLTLSAVRKAARACRACPLWRTATQTVLGEGAPRAPVMLVGEQPGDQEDLSGRPFVGPAGRLLDRALAEAGLVREDLFVTNVVKHFKWEPRGKRRIHQKPRASEVAACRPWLETEIVLVKPAAIVCLGATAAQALLGAGFKVTAHRGEFIASSLAPLVTATVHPSSLLRAPTTAARHEAMSRFVADLRRVVEELRSRDAL